jgi:hypothetical protein
MRIWSQSNSFLKKPKDNEAVVILIKIKLQIWRTNFFWNLNITNVRILKWCDNLLKLFTFIVYSMFVWRDSFITLGNSYQKFNLTTQLWSLIPTSAPISLYNPGCLVLPNEEILVVGSVFYSNRTLIYNHVTNSWRNLPDTNTPQGYTFLSTHFKSKQQSGLNLQKK